MDALERLCAERFEAVRHAPARRRSIRPLSLAEMAEPLRSGGLSPDRGGSQPTPPERRLLEGDHQWPRPPPAPTADRYKAGVMPYKEMGYFEPDYEPKDTDIVVLLPDHAAGRRRSRGGGGRGRGRELDRDLDRGLDRPADRLREVPRQVLPGRSGAGQSRAALRLHRLRPRSVRAGLDRQPDRLDHRQRVRLQAVEGAPARGHAPARRPT